jgi:hypothetical protein
MSLQPQYDISLGSNYDLFDDTMNNTISIGAAGGGGLWGTSITTNPGIIYTTNVGNPGQTLTWNGINTSWDTITTNTSGELHVKGDAEIEGDLKVKGKSLADAIDNIEKRLAILHPNKELEEKWDQLKALGERYRELEKDILEKEKIWETLKK